MQNIGNNCKPSFFNTYYANYALQFIASSLQIFYKFFRIYIQCQCAFGPINMITDKANTIDLRILYGRIKKIFPAFQYH